MSNRFHNKFHKHNHHTRPTDREGLYPDSAYDPIASPESPFQGEFYVDGDITSLSSLRIEKDANIVNDLTATNAFLRNNLNVTNQISAKNLIITPFLSGKNLHLTDDATIQKNCYVFGNSYVTNNSYITGNVSITDSITIDGTARIKTVPVLSGINNRKVLIHDATTNEIKYSIPNYRIWDVNGEYLSANQILTNRIPVYTGINTLATSPIFINGTTSIFYGNITSTNTISASGGNSQQWNKTYDIVTRLSADWNYSLENVNTFNNLLTTLEDGNLTVYNAACANVVSVEPLSANYFVVGESTNRNNKIKTTTRLYDTGAYLQASTDFYAAGFYGIGNTVTFTTLGSNPKIVLNNNNNTISFVNSNQNTLVLNSTEASIQGNLNVNGITKVNQLYATSLSATTYSNINAATVKAISAIVGDITTSTSSTSPIVTATLKIAFTGATNRVYGGTSMVPVLSVDSKGRVLSAVDVVVAAISALSGDVNAQFDGDGLVVSTLANTSVVAGRYGGFDKIPIFNVDSKGRLLSAFQTQINAISTLSGDVIATYNSTGTVDAQLAQILPVEKTNVRYGANQQVPTLTVDAKGRITDITQMPLSSTSLIGLRGDVSTNINERGIPTTTLSSTGVTPRVYGQSSSTGRYRLPMFEVDAKGRLTQAVDVAFAAVSALQGDVIASFGESATLNTQLAEVLGPELSGSYGQGNRVPIFSVNTKGLITDVQEGPTFLTTGSEEILGLNPSTKLLTYVSYPNLVGQTSYSIDENFNLTIDKGLFLQTGPSRMLLSGSEIKLGYTTQPNSLGYQQTTYLGPDKIICSAYGGYADTTLQSGIYTPANPEVIYGGFVGASGNSLRSNSVVIRGGTDGPEFTKGSVSINTNNSTRFHITSSGKIGINTENPEKTLHVVGDIACGVLNCAEINSTAAFIVRDLTETVSLVTITGNKAVIDLRTGTVFNVSLTENITNFEIITNANDVGSKGFTLKIKRTSDAVPTVQWVFSSRLGNSSSTTPISMYWAGGIKPQVTSLPYSVDIFTFTRVDASNEWYAGIVGQNFRQ